MEFYSPSSQYNVFLSFREEDTGRTFVIHIYRLLDRKGIQTYKDENQQTRNGRITPEVAQAIRKSDIHVVVISENYASSAWCLNVLAEIMTRSMYIKPVFYEVDPEDLTGPTGQFADDLRRHGERENRETVNRWRNALERLESTEPRFCSRNWEDDSQMIHDLIINITAPRYPKSKDYHPQKNRATLRSESEMRLMSDIYMKHIPKSLSGSGETGLESYAQEDTSLTDDILNELPSPSPDDSNKLVGMYRHKKAVYAMLDLESKNNVRIIGIWGIQGVGKSTLTECTFKDISHHFQHHCFLTKVNNIYQHRISPSLLKHLTGTRSSNNIFDAIKPHLVNRKVLLIFDGADDKYNEQFKDAMKVIGWLGPGSRVIMTSREEYTLLYCGVKYEMECMAYDEALQLFSLFAFKKTCPLIGFEGFSVRAVHFAGRRPLALKVLGSLLYNKDKESWKRTLRKLEASEDTGSRQISNYIGAREYLPRRPIETEQYVRADEEEPSSSYHMLL